MPRNAEAGTDERAPQGQRVPLIPRHGHTDQIAVSDDAVGRIEVDPSGARQVRLHPAVGEPPPRAAG